MKSEYNDYEVGSVEDSGIFNKREKELYNITMGERLSAGFAILYADEVIEMMWMGDSRQYICNRNHPYLNMKI